MLFNDKTRETCETFTRLDMVVVADYSRLVGDAANHRHVVNTLAALNAKNRADGEHIIGTEHLKMPELYGWTAPVPPHRDKTGFCYFMPLLVKGEQWIIANRGYAYDQVAEVRLKIRAGLVYRMNDYALHEVVGRGDVVAVFIGVYPLSSVKSRFDRDGFNALDLANTTAMRKALALFGEGSYSAPRLSVRHGVMPDECLIHFHQAHHTIACLQSDLDNQLKKHPTADVATCAQCDGYASVLDHHFPMYQSGNLCADCNFPNVFIGQINHE